MQRKNNILRKARLKRSGFAMIMALSVIVIVATIMALSLSLTSESGKRMTDLYLYEQSVLYSKSAAERALLDISLANPCTVQTRTYNFNGNLYVANVTLTYIYYDDPLTAGVNESPCTTAAAGTDYFTVTTPEQNGSVLMDITVSTNVGTEPIRYFRRSIQKL